MVRAVVSGDAEMTCGKCGNVIMAGNPLIITSDTDTSCTKCSQSGEADTVQTQDITVQIGQYSRLYSYIDKTADEQKNRSTLNFLQGIIKWLKNLF